MPQLSGTVATPVAKASGAAFEKDPPPQASLITIPLCPPGPTSSMSTSPGASIPGCSSTTRTDDTVPAWPLMVTGETLWLEPSSGGEIAVVLLAVMAPAPGAITSSAAIAPSVPRRPRSVAEPVISAPFAVVVSEA